ncbi:MAG: hypothetical protein PHW65_06785, partial [Dehalococcoidales bacterium]|nr:hypothetical protein [Dehalococcoidales bacterium]
TNTNCVAIGGQYGFNQGTNTNCVAIGGQYGFNQGTNTNCVAIGGLDGFNQGTNTNCVAIGGYYGFNQGTNTNCVAIGGYYGFNGSGTYTFKNCRAVACYYGFYGTSTSNKMDISTCSYVWCRTNYRTGSYTTEDGSLAKAVIFDLLKLVEAFQPLLQFNLDDGDNTVTVPDFDILGYVRRLGDGNIDIGPYEHSIVYPEFTTIKTVLPSVKIERAGQQKFTFFADGEKEFSRSIYVKWSNVAADKKPQLIAKGLTITTQTATATGNGTEWEKLTVTATPSVDGEVELYLYARDTAANAVVYFSDLE